MKRALEARVKLVEKQKKSEKEEMDMVVISYTPEDETSSVDKEVGSSRGM